MPLFNILGGGFLKATSKKRLFFIVFESKKCEIAEKVEFNHRWEFETSICWLKYGNKKYTTETEQISEKWLKVCSKLI